MLHPSRPIRHLCLLLLFFCLTNILGGSQAQAQTARPMTRPYADHHWFNWGFHIGVHLSDLIIDNVGSTAEHPEAWYAAVPGYAPGFSVGGIANYNLHLNWSIRLLPTLHFGERKIAFRQTPDQIETLPIRTTQIEVPLLVKYSSVRLNDIRPYLIGGGYTTFTVGQKKGAPLQFSTIEGGLSIGLGCDIYLRYFKLSPELRMNFGMSDMIRHKRPDLEDSESMRYTDALKRATGRSILLTFCFE